MQISDFTLAHIEQAEKLSKQNYEEERNHVPILPCVSEIPKLKDFAENSRGISLTDNDKLLGFFCWLEPWDNHFGLTKGTWSPMHAHGAVSQNRAEIYDRLYQAAAEKLVSSGVLSHAVTLYEHDNEANKSFSQNGFGKRCVDAVRETTPISAPLCGNFTFRQAEKSDAQIIAEMRNNSNTHLSTSPMFMPLSSPITVDNIINEIESVEYKYFVAAEKNRIAAYYRIQKDGENFVCDDTSMMNITGAYAFPKVRGTGVSAALLSFLMDWLKEHGYSRCSVDFECFNFTAQKFWNKYFAPYTNGVVRRIDERIYRK